MRDAFGPVDFLILEYPSDSVGEATAAALGNLVDEGTVAVYDLMIVRKEDDGTAREVPLDDGSGIAPSFAGLAGARSHLLGPDDVVEAAKAIAAGTTAVVVLYENRWAAPFVAAARSEGVEVVASARLGAQEIMDALDELETAS